MLPDLFSRAHRRDIACLLCGAALVSACAAPLPTGPAVAPVEVRPTPPAVAAVEVPRAAPEPPPEVLAPPRPAADTSLGVAPLLRYAERVRTLGPGELALEIAALGEPGPDVQRQMQLALALMHSHQPVDTAKALGLLQRVAATTTDDTSAIRPLARLLSSRLLEQRKLEDAGERQAQQLRDQQRRIDQLTDRLEAMRAIERSLNARPPAAPRPAAPGTTP